MVMRLMWLFDFQEFFIIIVKKKVSKNIAKFEKNSKIQQTGHGDPFSLFNDLTGPQYLFRAKRIPGVLDQTAKP